MTDPDSSAERDSLQLEKVDTSSSLTAHDVRGLQAAIGSASLSLRAWSGHFALSSFRQRTSWHYLFPKITAAALLMALLALLTGLENFDTNPIFQKAASVLQPRMIRSVLSDYSQSAANFSKAIAEWDQSCPNTSTDSCDELRESNQLLEARANQLRADIETIESLSSPAALVELSGIREALGRIDALMQAFSRELKGNPDKQRVAMLHQSRAATLAQEIIKPKQEVDKRTIRGIGDSILLICGLLFLGLVLISTREYSDKKWGSYLSTEDGLEEAFERMTQDSRFSEAFSISDVSRLIGVKPTGRLRFLFGARIDQSVIQGISENIVQNLISVGLAEEVRMNQVKRKYCLTIPSSSAEC